MTTPESGKRTHTGWKRPGTGPGWLDSDEKLTYPGDEWGGIDDLVKSLSVIVRPPSARF